MHPLTMEEVIAAIGGRALAKPPIPTITAVGTDSRSVTAGEIFFALKGPRYDGHAFVEAALGAGSAAAVVSDRAALSPSLQASGRLVIVPDTTAALGQLAKYYRRQIPATVIAIAGSNGKTTTKAMIHAVL